MRPCAAVAEPLALPVHFPPERSSRKKSAPYNMYHPAPAVKRFDLRHVKTDGCIAQARGLQINLCSTDQTALTMIPVRCATWKKMLWSTTQARC